MYRRLALAGLLATASTQAYALGLGPIKLHSGLNQPLNADVELLSGSSQDLSQLRVSLAPSAAFQQAGVQRTMLLTRLNFKVVKRPNGAAFIHISSPMPIREPFLDFVLEVDWSGGQLMREYTVLINPPTFMAHAAPPPASAPATGTAAHQPHAASASSAPASGTPTMSQAAAAAGDQAHSGQYGPTKRTDTLWKIAGEVRPDDRVTREQAMLALLRANPDAFYGGNINRLKAGYVLRVPDRSDMVSMSRTQARAQVAQQNTVWREARNNTGKVERQASTKPAASQASGGHLKLLAPESDQQAQGAAGGTGSAGGATGTATAAAGDDVASLRKQLDSALAAAAAQRHQTEQLQSQVAQLQKQVQSMHHLIEMRDGKLAQLQGQSAAAGTGAATPAPAAAAATGAPDASGTQAQSNAPTAGAPAGPTDAAATDSAAKPEAPAKPEGSAQPEASAKPANGSPVPAPPAAEQPKPTPSAAPKPAPTHHVAPTPPAPQLSIWDELLENPMMVGLGGAGTLLVLLLGWVSMRRRRMTMTEFQESILAAEQAGAGHGADGDAAAAVADSTTDSSDGGAGESSLLSDFAVSDMDAIQSEGEADPLAEADVYLAYGRYQQAEELVTEALKNAPERNDLHMKLLEIYHAAQNAPAFDGQAEAFLARLDNQDDPLWSRVADMGREISPDNPLYGSGVAEEASEEPTLDMVMPQGDASEAGDETTNELEAPELMAAVPDVDAAEPEVEQPQAAETDEADNGLDFDLDFDLGDDLAAPSAGSDADMEDLEFNLDSEEPKADADADADLSQVLNFDLDGDSDADRGKQGGEAVDTAAAGDALDMAFDADLTAPASEQSASADTTTLDEVGLDLDLGSLPELGEADTDEQGEADESEGLLSDVDEVGTKLDLARAYLDMGDPDGARSILEEVRQEGNGDQQEEARTLLAELA
ncbi:MAG TPA: FimV/HubP family polar landmark protein [Gammaproteobacteria bacterium]|nr:FimV/HubP family polar landmark protein [Gammaproteobacteria bacterium]